PTRSDGSSPNSGRPPEPSIFLALLTQEYSGILREPHVTISYGSWWPLTLGEPAAAAARAAAPPRAGPPRAAAGGACSAAAPAAGSPRAARLTRARSSRTAA